ncbi:Oidioi.mRNA.OKI2018_I69.XSR.g16030.t1.cds [Oikopleura dioica]|uniref:Oidioi.mRNA.OKI2018_I69.XSR.g16030.t1.cds n=1 Tax=Oikopleura dioica TaxID=34765 RepID=A0ABN7SM30_OIKDI|nr:Oidioi.mRNA.OKI2018_I69.XSR.g16030.t1.cds [Oikopleura dioica]
MKSAIVEQENKLKRLREEQLLLKKLEAGEDISSIIKFKEKIINREDVVETTVSFTANEEKKTESYKYEPIVFSNDGVPVPSSEELFKAGYTGAIRQPSDSHMASGYTAELGLRRALTDSFSSLFWRPKLTASEFEPVAS